ncbi:MAG: hypothetical protein LBT76_03400 [Tannerella sp.]|jgi:hypothetical protein|nr:hypothetical protein [Tannerella sp.]
MIQGGRGDALPVFGGKRRLFRYICLSEGGRSYPFLKNPCNSGRFSPSKPKIPRYFPKEPRYFPKNPRDLGEFSPSKPKIPRYLGEFLGFEGENRGSEGENGSAEGDCRAFSGETKSSGCED